MKWTSFKKKFPSKRLKEILTFQMATDVNGKKVSIISIDEVRLIEKDSNGVYWNGNDENLTHWTPLPKVPRGLN